MDPARLTEAADRTATALVRGARGDVDQELVAVTSFVFAGREDQVVEITGAQGEALILDKWGRLTKPLSGEGSRLVELLLDEVESLLRFLDDSVAEGFVKSTERDRLIVADAPAELIDQLTAFEPPAVEPWLVPRQA